MEKDSKFRLVLALLLPTVLVGVGIRGLHHAVAAFVLYIVGGCLVGPWWILGARPLRGHQGWTFRGVGGDRLWMHAGAWLVIGAGLVGLYLLLSPWLLDPAEVAARLESLGWPRQGQAFLLVGFVLVVPVAEEWWWRGQALPRCRRAFGDRKGIGVSVLAFSAYHVVVLGELYEPSSVMIRMIAIAGGGWIFSGMAAHTQGWRWSWSSHFAADLAIVAAFLLLVAPAI